MASKHAQFEPRWSAANCALAVTAFAIAFAAIVAAITVHAVDGRATSAQEASPTGPPAVSHFSQLGTIVAVSPTSVTALSVDGVARTYVINSDTNAITERGSLVGGAATAFAVNDEVSIVGIERDGTAVATAVADQRVSSLNGPPMDGV